MTVQCDQSYVYVLKTKRRVIGRLRKLVKPLLHPTGYVDDSEPDNRFRAHAFRGKDGHIRTLKIPRAIGAVQEVMGFTRAGVIVDAYGGGLVDEPFEDMPVEDLIRLEGMINNRKARGWKC